ncbi:hypothetical protein WMY93_002297 [Mugilogobius chulae]|uniref:Glycine N-acyltransferase N-terminal domain-containing protein n=1 Tax=Mugilogobius chulae TaxID=88201 RepID=A0AAW0PZ95_9GOBI
MKTLEKSELQVAEEVLKKHLPKSFKVYGILYYINRGKPTTLEVVVDEWPDFKVIMFRPDLKNKHALDYKLKVTVFSMDEQILRTMLTQEHTYWHIHFMFAGLDVSDVPIIREVSAMKRVNLKINSTNNLMHLTEVCHLNSPTLVALQKYPKYDLNFPSCCIKDEQDRPVSWILMYDYGAVGILYTVPEHRRKGYAKFCCALLQPPSSRRGASADGGSNPGLLQRLGSQVEVRPGFITEEEEASLLKELEPGLKRKRYEFDHWDNAIHGYRETERATWGPAYLDQKGYIKPHIDSVKFCGSTIAGLNLLSASVMRLAKEDTPDEWLDLLLPRYSLYIMRDEARYKFTHEILKDEESVFNGQRVPRQRRISVICRNLPS